MLGHRANAGAVLLAPRLFLLQHVFHDHGSVGLIVLVKPFWSRVGIVVDDKRIGVAATAFHFLVLALGIRDSEAERERT